MLHLIQNAVNSCDVTVSNESELVNPNYLWVLTNLESKDKTYFIPYNVTVPHAGRFDTFTFTTYPLQPEVLTGSTCNLHLKQGPYTYAIYDQVSSTNLNPVLSNNLVEMGLANLPQEEVCFVNYIDENFYEAVVYRDDLCFYTYISPNDDTNMVVYYNPNVTCFGLKWNEAIVDWNEATFNWETSNPVVN